MYKLTSKEILEICEITTTIFRNNIAKSEHDFKIELLIELKKYLSEKTYINK